MEYMKKCYLHGKENERERMCVSAQLYFPVRTAVELGGRSGRNPDGKQKVGRK